MFGLTILNTIILSIFGIASFKNNKYQSIGIVVLVLLGVWYLCSIIVWIWKFIYHWNDYNNHDGNDVVRVIEVDPLIV